MNCRAGRDRRREARRRVEIWCPVDEAGWRDLFLVVCAGTTTVMGGNAGPGEGSREDVLPCALSRASGEQRAFDGSKVVRSCLPVPSDGSEILLRFWPARIGSRWRQVDSSSKTRVTVGEDWNMRLNGVHSASEEATVIQKRHRPDRE